MCSYPSASVTTSRKEQAICAVCKSTSSLELGIELSLLVIDEADRALSVIISDDEAVGLISFFRRSGASFIRSIETSFWNKLGQLK
jgi:hypothetical protein